MADVARTVPRTVTRAVIRTTRSVVDFVVNAF
jgi:hypothetical protein